MSEEASTGAQAGTEGGNTPETAAAPEITTVEQLPEFARNLINQLRQENAAARVKKNEAAEAAKAQTKEEFEAALAQANTDHQATQTQLDASNLLLAKLNAAIEANVPVDKLLNVSSRLNGTTPEELKKDVEEVKALFGIGEPAPRVPATDPSQGKGSTPSGQEDTDPFAGFIMDLWSNNS